MVKIYEHEIIGICGIIFELLAFGSFIYGELNIGLLLALFGLMLIPIGFMVEKLEHKHVSEA